MTHLDPRANALPRFARDVLALLRGERVHGRHYDHRVGRFVPHMIKTADILIVSGLHAGHVTPVVEAMDVRIFLAMDEPLRRALKLRRDVRERGHAPEAVLRSLDRRSADTAAYIVPQEARADLVFGLAAARAQDLDDPLALPRAPALRLTIRSRQDLAYDEVLADLLALGGITVQERHRPGDGEVALMIADEEIPADLIEAVAIRHAGPALTLLAPQPLWQAGLSGLMQLLVVLHLAHLPRLQRRSWA